MTVVHELAAWVQRLPPRQPRMEALATTLVEDFGDHAEPVTSAGLAAIEAVAHRFCRHLQLELHPAGDLVVDRTAPGWPPEDATEIRRLGAPISSVRRTDDGLAVVAVDSMPSFAVSRSFVEAAIALADGARGVALDLRRNGGGDPETVATVVGWLCGPDLDLSSVVYRDRVRHWTTPDGPTIPADVPVVILVSDRTYSSGEALGSSRTCRQRWSPVSRSPTVPPHDDGGCGGGLGCFDAKWGADTPEPLTNMGCGWRRAPLIQRCPQSRATSVASSHCSADSFP